MPTSPLRSSQRVDSLSTLILSEWSPRSSLVSTIKSPQRRGQYKLAEVHHNIGDSKATPSLSRGQVPKSNEHMEIIDEVLELKIKRVLITKFVKAGKTELSGLPNQSIRFWQF
jgi:hypothetical protein